MRVKEKELIKKRTLAPKRKTATYQPKTNKPIHKKSHQKKELMKTKGGRREKRGGKEGKNAD
ncbi:MAG: hypothetical protein ACI4K7_00860 [Oscillospiraceae bacterium]